MKNKVLVLIILPFLAIACSRKSSDNSDDAFLSGIAKQHRANECPKLTGSYHLNENSTYINLSIERGSDIKLSEGGYFFTTIDGQIKNLSSDNYLQMYFNKEEDTGKGVIICSKESLIIAIDRTSNTKISSDDKTLIVPVVERIQFIQTYALQTDGTILNTGKLVNVSPDWLSDLIQVNKEAISKFKFSRILKPNK